MGIDPGLTRCGYALIEQNGSSPKALSIGVITTPKEDNVAVRLAKLQSDLLDILEENPPDAMAVEKVFIEINRKSGTAVTQAAGIALALGAQKSCEIAEYSPKQIKKAVTNYGNAQKEQVQEMVKLLLGLSTIPKPADAADAAAVALCHLAQVPALH